MYEDDIPYDSVSIAYIGGNAPGEDTPQSRYRLRFQSPTSAVMPRGDISIEEGILNMFQSPTSAVMPRGFEKVEAEILPFVSIAYIGGNAPGGPEFHSMH